MIAEKNKRKKNEGNCKSLQKAVRLHELKKESHFDFIVAFVVFNVSHKRWPSRKSTTTSISFHFISMQFINLRRASIPSLFETNHIFDFYKSIKHSWAVSFLLNRKRKKVFCIEFIFCVSEFMNFRDEERMKKKNVHISEMWNVRFWFTFASSVKSKINRKKKTRKQSGECSFS